MKYKLLSGCSSLDQLNASVNKHLEEGWEIYGSPCCAIAYSNYHSGKIYSQAVIKKDGHNDIPAD